MRFPDLVREYTDSTGIADFVPTGPVSGFDTFATKLADGDEFYYSCINLDVPTEREVGLGTLNLDGSIGRAPLGGAPKTNFTDGVKTIAVVVASEWFDTLQAFFEAGGGGGGGGAGFPAGGATGQVLAKLSVADNDVYWVNPPGYDNIYADQHGVLGDGSLSDAAAFETFLRTLGRGNNVILPAGAVRFNGDIQVDKGVLISGHGWGPSKATCGTSVEFPAGSSGFHFRNNVESGTSGASGGGLRGFYLHMAAGYAELNGTCDYDGAEAVTLTAGVAANFPNRCHVAIEGSSTTRTIFDRTYQTTNGSPDIVATVTKRDYLSGTPFLGNYVGYPGQEVVLSHVPAGTTFAVMGVGGNATLSAPATANDTGLQLAVKAPSLSRVKAGGGTANLTIDNPGFGAAVTGKKIRRIPVGIYITTPYVRIEDVYIDYYPSGCAALLRGQTTDGSIADECYFNNVFFNATDWGVFLEGPDANDNTFEHCNFAGPKQGVGDNGFLGQRFNHGHWAFNNGITVYHNAAQTSIKDSYFEVGTTWLGNGKCVARDVVSMVDGSGFIVARSDGAHILDWVVSGLLTVWQGAAIAGPSVFYVGSGISGYPPSTSVITSNCWAIGQGGPGYGAALMSYAAPGGSYDKAHMEGSEVWLGTGFGDGGVKVKTSELALGPSKALTFNGTTVIDASRNGTFNSLTNAAGLVNSFNTRTGAVTFGIGDTPAYSGGDVTKSAGSAVLTIGSGKVTRAMLAVTAAAALLGATAAGAVTDLTPSQVKTMLSITSSDVSGLGYFATGTDAANLTGTISASRVATNALALTKLAQAGAASLVGATAAGDHADLTPAQATALLPVATTSAKGLLPQLSNVATEFLNGTGAFSTPAGGGAPGGSDRQIQFNNAGAFAGSAHVDVDADGDLRLDTGGTTLPGTDQMKIGAQRVAVGGGCHLRTLGEHGVWRSMQTDFGRAAVGMIMPNYGAATVSTVGMNPPTNVGNISASTPAAGRGNRERRVGRTTTAATAGLACGWTESVTFYSLGGVANAGNNCGFKAVFRWMPADAIGNGALSFCGVSSSVAAPSATTNPNTFTNCIGIGANGTSANMQLFYGGSAAQTQIDLGANFPANGNGTDIYELIIFAPPDVNNVVYVRVERLVVSTGASFVSEQVLNAATPGTQLPANTTFLSPRNFRSNNATAVSGAIADCGYTQEFNWN